MRKFLHAYVATVVAFWSLLLMPMMPAVAANSCEWDGSSSNLWSDSANWNNCGGGVPQNGDIVTLPTVASNKAMSNDIVGTLTLDQFYIADGYTLTGNAITVSGSMVFQSTGSTINVSALNFANAATGVSLQIDGTGNSIATSVGITLPAGDFNVYANADFTAPAFTGSMTNFNKWGASTLTSASGSTFTTAGGVNVSDGIWGCSSADCAGDSGNFIAQYSGAKLLFTGDASLSNDIGLNYLSGATAVGLELNDTVGVSLLGTLSANGSAQIQLGNGSNFQTIGSVNLISSLEVMGNSATTSQYLVSSSGLTNSGELSCTNVKCWLDTNSTTYDGVIRGKTGSIIQHSSADSLGTTVGNTIIESGATLFSDDAFSTTEPLSLAGTGEGSGLYQGALVADTNDVTYTGDIVLAADTTIYPAAGAEIILAGAISGAADLKISRSSASSFVTFDGTTANTYTGTTYVYGGLQLIKDPGVTSVPSNMVIDGTSSFAQVQINNPNQVADTANINMLETVVFNSQLQTDAETIGSLSGAGAVYIVQNTLNVGGDNSSTTYTGSITTNNIVPGTVNKQGTGIFTLNGTTSAGFEPNFTVSGGKLLVNSDYTGAEFGINGGTLGGAGTVGSTTGTNGVFSPGNSPGCVTVSGDLTLNSPTVFDQEITGGTACSQFDQTTVTGVNGQIILNNPTLNVMLSYTPAPGTQFTIIRSLNNTITGQFNGLPDGTIFTANGVQFRINYVNEPDGESSQIVLTTIGGTLAQTGTNTSLITFVAIGLVFLALGGLVVERITRRRKYAHVK